MSLTKAFVIDYEEEIKHLFDNFNLSDEIYYDDVVATVNGFSGNFVGYYWDCHDQVYIHLGACIHRNGAFIEISLHEQCASYICLDYVSMHFQLSL